MSKKIVYLSLVPGQIVKVADTGVSNYVFHQGEPKSGFKRLFVKKVGTSLEIYTSEENTAPDVVIEDFSVEGGNHIYSLNEQGAQQVYEWISSDNGVLQTLLLKPSVAPSLLSGHAFAVIGVGVIDGTISNGSKSVSIDGNEAFLDQPTPNEPATTTGTLVSGKVVAGPVIATHELSVKLYAADGMTLLGESTLGTQGEFSITIARTYSGPVIARVFDVSDGADYMDEASRSTRDLNGVLLSAGVVVSGEALVLNITAVTSIAVHLMGGQTAGITGTQLRASDVVAKNTAVADALGLVDLTGSVIVATINADGSDNSAQANTYGKVLAALSGVDMLKSQTTQSTIEYVSNTLAAGVMSASLQADLINGGRLSGQEVSTVIDPSSLAVYNALGDELDTTEIAALRPAVAAQLTSAQVATVSQMTDIHPDLVRVIKIEAIGLRVSELSGEQLAALSVEQVQGLSRAQINALSPIQLELLGFDLVSLSMNLLSDTGDSGLSGGSTHSLTADRTVQVNGLSAGDSWEYTLNGGATWQTGSGSTFELTDTNKPVWSFYKDGDELKIRSYVNGSEQFELRLGSSGALSDISDLSNGGLRMVSDHLGDAFTDRVLQWTLWDHQLTNSAYSGDQRFNVTQAGNGAGEFQPTVTVNINRAGVIDIWSTPDKQWQVPGFTQDMAALTRYEFLVDGVIKVRHLVQVGDVTLNGTASTLNQAYFENWLPFLKNGNGGFTGMALELNASGGVVQGYSALDSTYPEYPSWTYNTTKGYAVVYNENAPGSTPAIGVVFGTGTSSDGRAALNTMRWDTGIGVLPSLQANQPLQNGAVIDSSYYLVMRPGLSSELATLVSDYAALATAPTIWQPNETPDDLTSGLIERLSSYRTGTPPTELTDSLSDLVTVSGSPRAVDWPALSAAGAVSSPNANTYANLAAADGQFGAYAINQVQVRLTDRVGQTANTSQWRVDDQAPVIGLGEITVKEDWANGTLVFDANSLAILDTSSSRLTSVSLVSANGPAGQALALTDLDLVRNGDVWTLNLKNSGANKSGTVQVAVSATDATGLTTERQLTVKVAAVDDKPTIPNGLVAVTTTRDTPIAFQISSKVSGLITDPDNPTTVKGIAINFIHTDPIDDGVWEYSTDNSTWTAVPIDLQTDNYISALYLNASDYLRFTPQSEFAGQVGLVFRAAADLMPDTTSGTRLNQATHISTNQMTQDVGYFWTTVNAPVVIQGTTVANLTETNAAQSASGTLSVSDPNSAQTFVAQSNVVGSNGYGSFSLDANGAWAYTMGSAHNEFVKDQQYTDSFTAVSDGGISKVITVTMTGTDDKPVVDGTGLVPISGYENTVISFQVSDKVADLIDDPDNADTVKGIAIHYVQSDATIQGTWEYSTDNSHWTAVPLDALTDSYTSALYLNASDYLRFTPLNDFTGNLGLYFRVGGENMPIIISGTRLNQTTYINAEQMTQDVGYFWATINEQVVIQGTTAASLTESDSIQSASGTLSVSDPNSAQTFVAQSSVAGSNGYGSFSLDANGAWAYTMGSAHNEFVKDQQYTDSFTAVSDGGISKVITVTMTGTNDRPQASASMTLSTTRDTPSSFQIADLVVKDINWTDVDAGDTLKGIAISWNQTTSEQGTWEWSTDGSSGWAALPDLSTNQPVTSVFMNATDYLLFTPATGYTGGADPLYFRVVDSTFADTASGSRVNVTLHNGTGQPISSAALTAAVTVTVWVPPVVIDVNRDGLLDYGHVSLDVNGDGHLDFTRWAGAGDGVLLWNKYADGIVHNHSQYAFSQYDTTSVENGRAPTDLSGLACKFDTNEDGYLDAADTLFDQFMVWQDVNQNGISEAGEVRSLNDWGVVNIHLVSDGVIRTPVAGVTEAGRSSAFTSDGVLLLAADAAFEYTSGRIFETMIFHNVI